jgi:hypothetical protein
MHATVRRYEGIDRSRTAELSKKAGESLMPSLSRLPGFSGYYLIEAENGVMTSIDLFDNASQAADSTRIATQWVLDEKLEGALPNPPKVTDGKVIAHKTNGHSVA